MSSEFSNVFQFEKHTAKCIIECERGDAAKHDAGEYPFNSFNWNYFDGKQNDGSTGAKRHHQQWYKNITIFPATGDLFGRRQLPLHIASMFFRQLFRAHNFFSSRCNGWLVVQMIPCCSFGVKENRNFLQLPGTIHGIVMEAVEWKSVCECTATDWELFQNRKNAIRTHYRTDAIFLCFWIGVCLCCRHCLKVHHPQHIHEIVEGVLCTNFSKRKVRIHVELTHAITDSFDAELRTADWADAPARVKCMRSSFSYNNFQTIFFPSRRVLVHRSAPQLNRLYNATNEPTRM